MVKVEGRGPCIPAVAPTLISPWEYSAENRGPVPTAREFLPILAAQPLLSATGCLLVAFARFSLQQLELLRLLLPELQFLLEA